jgi:hypothetical protein
MPFGEIFGNCGKLPLAKKKRGPTFVAFSKTEPKSLTKK